MTVFLICLLVIAVALPSVLISSLIAKNLDVVDTELKEKNEKLEKLIHRLGMFLLHDHEDSLFEETENWPDEKADVVWELLEKHVTKPALKMMCDELGHEPTMDQCMLPEHDFCFRCNEMTPGMAPRWKETTVKEFLQLTDEEDEEIERKLEEDRKYKEDRKEKTDDRES